MDTLDNILSEEQDEIVEQTAVAEEVTEETPKGEEESASPAPAEEPPYEHAAVKGERERRQKAEQRLTELEKQLQALQSPAAEPEPPANMWEDEEKWQAQFGGRIANQAALNARLDTSEMLARRDHKEDFDQMKELFLNLANESPVIAQQALNDPEPWERAYQIAKNHSIMQELGATDVATMREKLREEWMAEMAAGTPATRQQVPPTLVGERNVGARKGPEWTGPKALDELLR